MGMNTAPIKLWTAQALPATGSVTSNTISVARDFGYAVQVIWSSGPTGVLTLQGSCDNGLLLGNGSVTGVSNWTTITGTSTSITGTSGSVLYNIADVYYFWFQLVYTATSGTGTASANCTVKGL